MAQSAEIERRVQARAARAEPARARRVHAAALRRAIDRGNQRGAQPRDERRQAQRVSRGEEAARRAGAAEESGIVSATTLFGRRSHALLLRRRRAAATTIERHSRAVRRARRSIARSGHARDDCRARGARARRSGTASKSGSASGTSCRSVRSRGGPPFFRRDRLVFAAAAAMLVLVAFVAGRVWPRQPAGAAATGAAPDRRRGDRGSMRRRRHPAAHPADLGGRSPRSVRAGAHRHHERAGSQRHLERAAMGGRPADHEPAVSAGRRSTPASNRWRRCSTSSSAACSKSSTARRRSARRISSRFGGGSTRRRSFSKCG